MHQSFMQAVLLGDGYNSARLSLWTTQEELSLSLSDADLNGEAISNFGSSYQGEWIDPFQRLPGRNATFRRCWTLPTYAPSCKYGRFKALLFAMPPR
ncbi:uncharacterized protein J3R85_015544 [Psidium guajava]|nr:uncharacterized protein J3R85_015544 [Psidium guajava]